MMQLICNGVRLDLYEDVSLQFTHNNPLFAFDKLACERTTEFKLPCTPTNDRVLSIARIPAYDGEGMRRKFATQMQDGSVVMDGYLYVSAFDGKDYKAVFVTGELVGLQAIKDAGKIADIMDFNDTIQSPYVPKPSHDATFSTDLFAAFMYGGESGTTILPSINLGILIDQLCAHLNISCSLPSEAYDMRIVVPELVEPEENKGAHIHSIRTGSDPINTIYPNELQRLTIEEVLVSAPITTTYRNGYNNPVGEIIQQETNGLGIRFFKSLNDITIKFPDNFSSNYFLMGITVDNITYFLGNYSFTKSVNAMGDASAVVSGTPLAGRSIEIGAGVRFLLVTTDDLTARAVNTIIQIDDEPVAVTAVTYGWECTNGLNYDFAVEMATDNENQVNVYRLQDNLPDYTLTDLLKYIAAELGLQLNYTDADGILFDDLDFTYWNVKNMGKVISIGEVTRRFMDYGQNSLVKYSKDDAFLPSEQSPMAYTIDNDNLPKDVELIVLGWTNGGFSMNSGGIIAFDRVGRTEFMEIRKNPNGYDDGLRAYVVQNANLQALCDASTQVIVQAHMTMAEYMAITSNTLIQVNGTQYVWTSRQWQNDTAKFTLAKI